ncbi:MAG: phage integrase N-terminal SAM-like domain-containing protein [Rubrivivax sp.]
MLRITSDPPLPPLQSARLLDQVRERIRYYLHYSLRTEQAYVHWVRAFVRFHRLRHPRDMGRPEVEAFLSWLAADRHVAVSTHRQALSALLFLYQEVIVRCGKGGKDRAVMLPATLLPQLPEQLARARVLWEADAHAGRGGVFMPDALDRKCPQAGAQWAWFGVFPQADVSIDPRSGVQRRHHVHEQSLQQAFKRAVARAGVQRPSTPHTLRHLFVTYLLQAGYDIRTVQALLGHSDVNTTMIYTHVLEVGGGAVRSPLDALAAGPAAPHRAQAGRPFGAAAVPGHAQPQLPLTVRAHMPAVTRGFIHCRRRTARITPCRSRP